MAATGQGAAVPSSNDTDNVTIRVIALTHATSHNEDVNLVVSLDSTVAQLKVRFQQSLSQHPRPETQRLIYQGRPLTNDTAVLRQLLRLEPERSNTPSAHVIHLVVRDEQPNPPDAGGHPTGQSLSPATTAPNSAGGASSLPSGLPAHEAHLRRAQLPQEMIQNQLNAMQQHMAMHHQHMQQHYPVPHLGHPPQPFPAMNLDTLAGRNIDMPPTSTHQGHPPNPLSRPNTQDTGLATVAAHLPVVEPQASDLPRQAGMNVRIQEATGPNGERIRTVIRSGPLLPAHTIPVERSASAPGSAPRTGLPGPAIRPPFAPLPLQLPQLGLPPEHNAPIHGHELPTRTYPTTGFSLRPARNPTLWLLSSPSGPEALLFTPQHGVFSTQQTAIAQPQQQLQAHATDASDQPPQSHPTGGVPRAQDEVRDINQGQVALRPPLVPPNQAPVQPARREGEDLLALVLQRGWLFLRLYMFIFVLSEAGTWRRYILLTVASLVCLLPRNNPFTDMLQAARRHFDNLIGPPQPPVNVQAQNGPGQQPEANQHDRTAAPDGAINTPAMTEQGRNTSQMPSPEEHARRLLREHEQRNPNIVRDMIYRVEQAVALFLASLVPGVGERHVRAREDARRIVQEEEERRQREEAERRQQEAEAQAAEPKLDDAQPDQSDLPPPSSDAITDNSPAMSSGVDTSPSAAAGGEGMRLRNS